MTTIKSSLVPGPRMTDVAERAGVSIATVSNTLNNPSVVSEQTQARVWLAIEELRLTIEPARASPR